MRQLEQYLLGMSGTEPSFASKPVDTRKFQQYDKSNPKAQKQIGSTPVAAFLAPNNPYQKEAEQAALTNVYNAVTDPMAGYTRNGIPHNDPKVIDRYVDDMKKAFKDSGVSAYLKDMYTDIDGRVMVQMGFDRGNGEIGFARRLFTPEGVRVSMLKNELPTGERMGVMPYLYPAESEFMQKYGGQIEGNFVADETLNGFKRSNPTAAQPDPIRNRMLRATYDGLEDFSR